MLRRSGYLSPPETLAGTEPEADMGAVVKKVVSGSGQPLEGARLKRAEAVFQEDFSDVRVHTDVVAQRSAENLSASAYTVGNDIVSGTGSLDDKTLYHELTHVSQQRKGPVAAGNEVGGVRTSTPGDPFEREATANERLADSPGPVQLKPADGPAHAHPDHAHHDHGPVQRTPAHSAAVQRMAKPERRTVLVVCDESGLGLGGVPVFNMELVKGLQPDHDVTLFTVNNKKDYDHDKTVADHGGAKIINVPGNPDIEEGRDRLAEVAEGNPKDHGLPDDPASFDIIMGHSRFSGPAAEAIRRRWYPEARLVHFLHTSPERLDRVKGKNTPDDRELYLRWKADPESVTDDEAAQAKKFMEKTLIERSAMAKADVVSGVGPLLTKEAARLAEKVKRAAVHEFVPGTEAKAPVKPSLPNRTKYMLHLPRKLKLLLPGRVTDEIKGAKAAIMAIGQLRRPVEEGGYGLDVRLTIRGGPRQPTLNSEEGQEGHQDKLAKYQKDLAKYHEDTAAWQQIINAHGEGGVTLLPFTPNADELDADYQGKHGLIMPSLHEGFGLVATEAAGRKLPILVTQESGAAQFLQHFENLSPDMSVEAPYQVDSETNQEVDGGEDKRAAAWASAIANLHRRLPAARKDAGKLQEILTHYTWQSAANALIDATMRTTPRTAADDGVRGGYTRQGPDAGLEDVEEPAKWVPHDFWDGATPEPTMKKTWPEEERIERMQQLAEALTLEMAEPEPVAEGRSSSADRSIRRTKSAPASIR
ncbi:DUF4157 domain-containing protein [Streptomyces sp. NPDC059467]|uniref:eCIS core domain-containing protein n=1 Tax=Streptomyces sp. NPDC059467 TaxID=3346844 RepID=UPI00367DF986